MRKILQTSQQLRGAEPSSGLLESLTKQIGLQFHIEGAIAETRLEAVTV